MSVDYAALSHRLTRNIVALRIRVLQIQADMVETQQQHEEIERAAQSNLRQLQVGILLQQLKNAGRFDDAELLESTFPDDIPILETRDDAHVSTTSAKYLLNARGLTLANYELLQRQLQIVNNRLARFLIARLVIQWKHRR